MIYNQNLNDNIYVAGRSHAVDRQTAFQHSLWEIFQVVGEVMMKEGIFSDLPKNSKL